MKTFLLSTFCFLFCLTTFARVSSETETVNLAEIAKPSQFSACVEAENSPGSGSISNDPNASGGQTRGDEFGVMNFVDYALNGVTQDGVYRVTLRYYAAREAKVSVFVNWNQVHTALTLPPTHAWNIVSREETFDLPLVAGVNTIRILGVYDGGSIRQDKICVSGLKEPLEPACDFNITTASDAPVYLQRKPVTLTATCNGAHCGAVSYKWSGNGLNAVGAVVNLESPGITGTYTYTVTASEEGCADKVSTVAIKVESVLPGCFAMVTGTANTFNPQCSSPVSLGVICTGSDCDDYTFIWSGNGVNQTGRGINITSPAGNGAFTYQIKGVKAGCPDQFGSVTIHIDDCEPPVGENFSACLEAESSAGSGLMTADPNASNGMTRGEENAPLHYVDYLVKNVPAAGVYQVKLRYAANGNAYIGVNVNWVNVIPWRGLPSTNSWNIVFREETLDLFLSPGDNYIRIQGMSGPSVRQDKLCVTGKVPENPQPACDFTVSAASDKPFYLPKAPATLTSNCTGPDCAGVSYQWNGYGILTTNASVTFNAPEPFGEYTYTLTASKNGCNPQVRTRTIVVSNPLPDPAYNACIEAEDSEGDGPITSDPNASNGSTRGDENNPNTYVTYTIPNVLAAGTYQLTLRYSASGTPTVNINTNGSGSAIGGTTFPSTNSWNIVFREETFNVRLRVGDNTIRFRVLEGPAIRQDKICVVGPVNTTARMGGPEYVTDVDLQSESINVFPNPAPGEFKVKFEMSGAKGSLSITDVQGKTWYNTQVNGAGSHEKMIVLPNAPAGIYLMNVKSGEKSQYKKLLLVK